MLRLTRAAHDELVAHAAAGYPDEVVGLLASRADDGAALVVRAWPLANEHVVRRGRFFVSEPARAAAEAALANLGLVPAGLYHSHPDGAAVCSGDDRRRLQPGVASVIVAVGRAGVVALRGWRRTPPDVVTELVVTIT